MTMDRVSIPQKLFFIVGWTRKQPPRYFCNLVIFKFCLRSSGQLLSVQQLSSGRSHISHFKPDAALKAQQSTQNLDRPLAVESENLTATVFGPHLAKISICIPHF
jgi:hypothetical protein